MEGWGGQSKSVLSVYAGACGMCVQNEERRRENCLLVPYAACMALALTRLVAFACLLACYRPRFPLLPQPASWPWLALHLIIFLTLYHHTHPTSTPRQTATTMLRSPFAALARGVTRQAANPLPRAPAAPRPSIITTTTALPVHRLLSTAAANAEGSTTPVPQSTLRHAAFSLIHGAEGKPLHNRDIFNALHETLPPTSPLKERLTLTFLKTKILRQLREKNHIRSVAIWTEGKKRASYGYVVSKLPKEYKTTKPVTEVVTEA